MTPTEQIAAVLAEHYDVVAGGASAPGVWFCQCGEDIARGSDDTEAKHQGHVAAYIAPLVRQAQAEALREAAGALDVEIEHDDVRMRPVICRGYTGTALVVADAAWDATIAGKKRAARIIRDRADQIKAETDGAPR